MSTPVTIRSVDDLALHIGRVEAGEGTWDDVDLTNLQVVIPVTMKGQEGKRNEWDGRVDHRNAAFVQNLHKHVRACYKEATGTNMPSSVLIKAESKEGSNLFDIDFTQIITEAIKNVPPELIAPLLTKALFCGAGVYAFGRLLVFLNDSRTATIREKEIALLEKATDAVRDTAMASLLEGKDPSMPIRRYVKTMRRGDTVSVGESDKFSKREALEGLPSLPDEKTLYYTHADNDFDLVALSLAKTPPVLTLQQGERQAKGYFFSRLSEDARTELTNTIQSSLEQEAVVSMPLQVDVYFTRKKLDYCVIVGIGEPRGEMEHYRLEDIPDGVRARDWLLPGVNA